MLEEDSFSLNLFLMIMPSAGLTFWDIFNLKITANKTEPFEIDADSLSGRTLRTESHKTEYNDHFSTLEFLFVSSISLAEASCVKKRKQRTISSNQTIQRSLKDLPS